MKFLILIFALAFNVTANAQDSAKSNCAAAAESVAKQMFLGTSNAENRNITTVVQIGYDENSSLVFETLVKELAIDGSAYAKYKVIAKGSEEACEILSVNKLAN